MTHTSCVELGDDREASIRGCDLGPMRVCMVALGEYELEGSRVAEMDRSDARVKFLFVDEGAVTVEQSGRTTLVTAGEWCAIDRALPFYQRSEGESRQLALTVPRHRLANFDRSTRTVAVAETFRCGSASVLHSSISNAIGASETMGRSDRKIMGEALLHLLNAAWHAEPLLRRASGALDRRLAVIQFIDNHIGDPDLSIARIASELGYAKRTLHKLFADSDDTLGKLIWQKRLERCREDLLDPSQHRRSITDIALSWGFSDSQHFSRSFKKRFGICPSDFRQKFVMH